MALSARLRSVLRFAKRCALRVFSRYSWLLLVADTSKAAEPEAIQADRFQVSFGRHLQSDALAFLQSADPYSHSDARRRLIDHDVAVIGRVDGDIAYVSWLRGDIQMRDVPPKAIESFKEPSGYLWGILVAPQYRGRGIATHVGAEALRYCQYAGWRWVWVSIHQSNIGSLRSHIRQGFLPVGTKTRWIVCGITIWSFRILLPYAAIK